LRILAVDLGRARIGIAVGVSEFKVATPRTALKASGKLKTDALAIVELARREEAETVILGLPIEEDGEEGSMARIARLLAGHIEEQGLKVELVDERFTSVEAESALRESDLKAAGRRKLRDGEAASLILERYWNGETAD
jgi:putative Holliday junction resolvase